MSGATPPQKRAGRVAAWGAHLIRVRWLMRAPIGLCRMRLGGLLGRRFLMLEHRGRTSGLARDVVLEVVSHPEPGSYIVASAFGEHSQWFRNVQADPQVRLYIGGRRPAPATGRVLAPSEARQAIVAYRAAHPKAWSSLKQVLEAVLGTPVDDDGSQVPLVRFDLASLG